MMDFDDLYFCLYLLNIDDILVMNEDDKKYEGIF